jgi:NADPH:quinone reductase-like Zn-dependent oxidoreductase
VFTLLPLLTGKGRKHHGEIMGQATRMAEAGQLRVLLDDQRFTLAQTHEAFQRVSSASARGKLVIDIA